LFKERCSILLIEGNIENIFDFDGHLLMFLSLKISDERLQFVDFGIDILFVIFGEFEHMFSE